MGEGGVGVISPVSFSNIFKAIKQDGWSKYAARQGLPVLEPMNDHILWFTCRTHIHIQDYAYIDHWN